MTEAVDSGAPREIVRELSLRRELERRFGACELERPFRRARYDAGDELEYDVTGVVPARHGRLCARVERFVGGGFAGQVYRARLLRVDGEVRSIPGLQAGRVCAVKILRPPSVFAQRFRDFLYFLAYQGPFSAQVHPAAMRVGVLWQKLIRRAAAGRLCEDSVCETYATFYDPELCSHGEINEWVDGRIWKFEVDQRLFDRWKFEGDPPPDVGAPEYVHKKLFMRELVHLLHEMGAGELARQYEWWTCKSQPNALKRIEADTSPRAGLTAIDFRAGLALLSILPMSPVDVRLILRGLSRGRLVQFDRCDLRKLRRFVAERPEEFRDLQPAVEELERQEPLYRSSLPDLTHHHVRLLTDRSLRASVKAGVIAGWRSLRRVDAEHADRLAAGRAAFPPVFLLSLIPWVGPFLLRVWGDRRYREHVRRASTDGGYFSRTLRGSAIEALITWHRDGRSSDERTLRLSRRPLRVWSQRLLAGWMPAAWHRALAEPRWAWSRFRHKLRFLLQFLREPAFREDWLMEQIRLGRGEGMLTPAEAEKISRQVKDPYIQKYLRCLAVHLCTVPITQVAMVLAGAAAVIWCLVYRGLSWPESLVAGGAAAATIQLLPVSPGSLARGLFVLFLMVKERDVRNYYVAAPVSFLHVVGYLAFPLQLVAHDPALARFMAGRWARGLVRFVPIFGESGGLLEHAVFDLFFNVPLSVKLRFTTHPVRCWLWTSSLVALLVSAAVLLYLRFI